MEITWFLPGELEIRRRGSGSFLSGAVNLTKAGRS